MFEPPCSSGSGGVSNPLADNTSLVFGTTDPSSITAQVSGLVNPYTVIAQTPGNPIVFTTEANKNFDFIGTSIPFITFPLFLFTGADAVLNDAGAIFVNDGKFSINGIDGDGFADFMPANARGVSIILRAGNGGSLGGVPGIMSMQGGDARSGNINGANVQLLGGLHSGSGQNGVIEFGDSGQVYGGVTQYWGQHQPAVSDANSGKIYYDIDVQRFTASQNGSDFTAIGDVSQSALNDTEIVYSVGGNTISGNTKFVFDRSNLRFGLGVTVATGLMEIEGTTPSSGMGDSDFVSFTLGNGSDSSVSVAAGNGGDFSVTTGFGGAAGTMAAGNGGDIVYTTGQGGNGSGTLVGGNGGNFTITIGASGPTGGAGPGNPGRFLVNGQAEFNGDVLCDDDITVGGTARLNGNTVLSGAIFGHQGSDVASANDMSLAQDGNYYVVSGSTQINHIQGGEWQPGSMFILKFTGTPLIKYNQTASGDFRPILLPGSTDYTPTVGTSMQCFANGTGQFECVPFLVP